MSSGRKTDRIPMQGMALNVPNVSTVAVYRGNVSMDACTVYTGKVLPLWYLEACKSYIKHKAALKMSQVTSHRFDVEITVLSGIAA
jgi:hypothetical protein